jgi:hypothetical protein
MHLRIGAHFGAYHLPVYADACQPSVFVGSAAGFRVIAAVNTIAANTRGLPLLWTIFECGYFDRFPVNSPLSAWCFYGGYVPVVCVSAYCVSAYSEHFSGFCWSNVFAHFYPFRDRAYYFLAVLSARLQAIFLAGLFVRIGNG